MPLGLSGVRENLMDVTGQKESSAGGSYATLEEDDFQTWNGDNLIEGQWVDLAVYSVEPQVAYNVGYGVAKQDTTLGKFYARFEEEAEDSDGNPMMIPVSGQVRVRTRKSTGKGVDDEVSGVSTSRLNTDANDKRKQFALPERTNTDKVGHNSEIVIQFKLKPSSDGVRIDNTDLATKVMMDVTQYE